MTSVSPPSSGTSPSRKIRVMLVDDSAVIRGLIARSLESDPEIEIAGSAMNGEMAVSNVKRLEPDVLVLDIEMPVMDGLTALPLILKEYPDVKILMCSTLSERGAQVSIKALSLGAAECILKPSSSSGIINGTDFQAELLRIVRALGSSRKEKREKIASVDKPAPKPVVLQARSSSVDKSPKLIAIGSSTGGPKVLMDVMKDLSGLSVPIVITQHMPKTFTAILAQHIQINCNIPCHEGAEGMILEAGHAYVAPGGLHMILRGTEERVRIHLDDGPPENFCKPAVDPMLRSLVPIYGARILTAILTGMGSDGMLGSREIVNAGGRVIAQDEATSVVWGMPGAVTNAGLCTAVLPAPEIAGWIKKAIEGKH